MDEDEQKNKTSDEQIEEQPESNWKFDANETEETSDELPQDEQQTPEVEFDTSPFSWSEKEYVYHEKGASWYLALTVITVILAGAVYLMMHDFVSPFIIVILAIIFGVAAGRQPREFEYTLDANGIRVGQAYRPFKDFKSYTIVDVGALSEAIFIPLKRFSPPLTIYFDDKQADTVLGMLDAHLPKDQGAGNDAVDQFIRKIRF